MEGLRATSIMILAKVCLMFLFSPDLWIFPSPSAVAQSPSSLNCTVIPQPDGLFRYQLSEQHSSSCKISWEDQNKTVTANNFDQDRKLVQSQTNQSVVLRRCYDYLHYTRDCVVWEEAHCRVDCSLLLVPDVQRHTESTDWVTLLSITVPIIFLAAAGLVGLCIWIFKKRRTTENTSVSYSAPEQVQFG